MRRPSWWILIVVLTLLSSLTVSQDESDVIQAQLVPKQKLPVQVIYPNQTFTYLLSDLNPSHQYEVRISYPASTPAIFHMKLVRSTQHLRRRLNTEKVFVNGDDQFNKVLVWVSPEGISRDLDVQSRKTEFHIVIERVIAGIPESAFGMTGVLVCYIILAFWCIIPKLARFIEKVAEGTKQN